MRVPLRYYNPELQRLLINSYVSGFMSYRARRRMSSLLKQIPQLEDQLLMVEAQLQSLNINQVQGLPKAQVWNKIEAQLGWQVVRWWQKINYWRASSGALALSLLLVITLQFQSPRDVSSEYVPISYVGILNGHDSTASLAAAVHRETDAPNAPWMMTLHLTQPWSESDEVASLWITDNKGRKLSMGPIQVKDTQQFLLTAPQWQFIQGAVWMELIADNSGKVILQGQCLSLKQWDS
ncbi:hypothetical protein HWQ46_05575 [Shewanella sp. D64]|uniref:hypothetical protein n=1 Tax=unclassified Shewanella TaxID=196818 RepID=UPI0022BA5493|nr:MULTISPECIES: hypothetical protein [unclassified Shewanella]MEC4725022.1 hypothetical protein [Shewanella sp. D64]MEC4736923.1 hypothetical protein [Shewanella sp. E94]WBJ96518.1 hypothetical protein HWQ47_05180 [Shewanella sp. MTB7]